MSPLIDRSLALYESLSREVRARNALGLTWLRVCDPLNGGGGFGPIRNFCRWRGFTLPHERFPPTLRKTAIRSEHQTEVHLETSVRAYVGERTQHRRSYFAAVRLTTNAHTTKTV